MLNLLRSVANCTSLRTHTLVAWLLAIVFMGLISNIAQAASIEGILMPGPVSQAHAAFENNCEACHSPLTETKQQTLCLTCHVEVANDLTSAAGFHGKHPAVAQDQCQSCHREHKGRTAPTLAFDLTNFEHKDTDFPLHWAHADAPCTACHLENKEQQFKYANAPTECNACHEKDDTHQGSLGAECASCHSTREWKPALFDHSKTEFPLTGSHAAATCNACHTTENFDTTPSQCSSCHRQDDIHKGSFGSNCQQCHNTSEWSQSRFNHQLHTNFSLTEGHAGLACTSCHTAGLAASVLQGDSCASCHTKDDVHQGNNGNQCQSCHTTVSWQANTFNHSAETGFDLKGAHASLTCTQCHAGALSDPVGNSCHECHSPDPHAGQLGNNCQQCHNEMQWDKNLSFSHELTAFPLLGMHSELECTACHKNSRFHDSDSQCSSCHQADDVHKRAMGDDCGSCHNPATWTVQRFDHAEISGFALIGIHGKLTCATCHQNASAMQAQGPDECGSCHQQDDPHQNRFGSDCVQCHNNQSFREIKRL